MVHPVLFNNRCSCGGELLKVNRSGNKANAGDEIVGYKCSKCKDNYFVQWNTTTGEPKPLFSKEESIKNFLDIYKEI